MILPEVVTNSDDTYMMQYAPITALLVEAVKEQQQIIVTQQDRIKSLEENTEQMKADFAKLSKELENFKSQFTNK